MELPYIMKTILVIFVFIFSFNTQAKTWGPSKAAEPGFDREAKLDELYNLLAISPNEQASKKVFAEIWNTWMIAPDELAAENLNQALRARGGYNYDKAISILNKLNKDYPKFTQVISERSYVYFLKKDYERSLTDCEKVLEMDSRHLGCLSGMARILIRHQKRYKAGKSVLKKAMQWHPWIYERILLKEIPDVALNITKQG